MSDLAPEHIQTLLPYEPGKPEEEVERELGVTNPAKLASNENPVGPSPKAMEAIQNALHKMNRYPDGGSYYLRKALAEKHDLGIENIILGNGANEIIEIIIRTFLTPQDEAIMAWPAFSIFMLVLYAHNVETIRVPLRDYTHDLKAMADAVTDRTRMIFIANPNNPTGTSVGKEEAQALLDAIPEKVIVVMDEAYYEYVTRPDFPPSIEYMKEGRNVMVLRTFSKIYGLAGLRVGYGIAREELITDLNRVRAPFNVNSLAQAGALACLGDHDHVRRCIEVNDAGREYLYKALDEIGLEYVPTDTNFILVKVGKAREVFNKLLTMGVIVRPMDGYELPDHIRLSIGMQWENEKFIEAIRKLV
jgi:histidinol-phosphate aminotransferase